MKDRPAIYAAAFVRALATGMAGVLLGVHLAKLKLGPAASGFVVTAGLAGAAGAAVLATFAGDRWGRKRLLIGLALLSAGGGILFALTPDPFLMAVVRPEERTFASGVIHLVRVGAWAVAPSFAGLFMRGALQAAPLFVGAGLKIVYDILLYAAFRRIKPPEEESREPA
jgi:MFS family permease